MPVSSKESSGHKDRKTFYVVDGHALAYRAYFAFIKNPLITSSGQNVSAIFGFARMLLNLIKSEEPDYLAVAFDPPKKSFRFDLYPEYKANRTKMPDDMKSQIEEIRAMVDILGIARLENGDVEADDILGSIAAKYGSPELSVILVTGDKDAYQLVNDFVAIYANRKGIADYEWYDAAAVEAKLGITPSQVIDYMALMGDASDNIPGVKGIGEKTARTLIEEFGSLDGIYENIDRIAGKKKVLLEEGRQMAYLSRDLVTIKIDAPLHGSLDDYDYSLEATTDKAAFFNSLEMDSIVRDYFPAIESDHKAVTAAQEPKRYETVTNPERLREIVALARGNGIVAIDTETTSVFPNDADLVGISLSYESGTGWYIPLVFGGLFGGVGVEAGQALELLRPLIESPQVKKIGQNIKYEIIVFARAGLELNGIFFDTMVASYVLNTEERRHNLDDLAMKYLNHKTITFKELVGTGKKAVSITDVPLERLAEYAIEDADITWRLYEIFSKKLKEEKLEKLFFEMEMPLVQVLARMEFAGVAIDVPHFKKLAVSNSKRLDIITKEIYSLAGLEFNLNSTRELGAVLFEKLGLRSVKKTKTGQSTDISVLEELRGEHPIIEHIMEYRTLSKLKNTYIDTLPELVSQRTGRIHTSYNQTVVATGRLSSSDPNLQNIPVKNQLGRALRQGFIAGDGFLLMAADYSQIELRLAAHLSGDENMRKAFTEGIDIHNLTASNVFGVPIPEVDSAMRRQAKIINFATIYGVSPWGLSRQAEIGMKEAEEFIRIYFETYPGFKKYIEGSIAFAREHGYVETMLGRRRRLPDINSSAVFRREGAERMAINTPIQGTSADMIKVAMIAIDNEIRVHNMKSRMIMQVHDELVFEIHAFEKDTMVNLIKEKMESALMLSVPVVVDIGFGPNWDEAH